MRSQTTVEEEWLFLLLFDGVSDPLSASYCRLAGFPVATHVIQPLEKSMKCAVTKSNRTSIRSSYGEVQRSTRSS